ncbi:MAG TPA: cupin domain-containing protein [Gaiellaceae bacterium]|nr:cupin domain-containing protein [Gaiellaceae bacterium]
MEAWRLAEIDTPGGSRSPVVLKSDDEARAVLLGLAPGQELGDHQVKEHAWIVVVAGDATFRADGEVVDGGVGTLVRFEPDERHSVRSENGAKLLLLFAPWPGPGHYRGEEKTGATA